MLRSLTVYKKLLLLSGVLSGTHSRLFSRESESVAGQVDYRNSIQEYYRLIITRRYFLWVLLGAFFGACLPSFKSDALAEPLSESLRDRIALIEAGFLTELPLFVHWPEGCFYGTEGPLIITTYGETPVYEHLVALSELKRFKNRPIVIKRAMKASDVKGSHIAFIAKSNVERLSELIQYFQNYPVLTVADTEGFGRLGVMINFTLDEKGRVRFKINNSAAEASNLSFSFRLQQVGLLLNKPSDTEVNSSDRSEGGSK